MGHLYFQKKDTQKALENFRAVIRIKNEDSEAWKMMGEIFFIEGLYETALRFFG